MSLANSTIVSLHKVPRVAKIAVVLLVFVCMISMFIGVMYNRTNPSSTLLASSSGAFHNSESGVTSNTEATSKQVAKPLTYWTGIDKQFSKARIAEFMSKLKPDPKYEQVYGDKVMTCFTKQQHSLTCGLTNQLFELITCMAITAKVGAKKFIIPSMCTDGNWGLCYCQGNDRFSKFFDLERTKKLAQERFGISMMEYEESSELLKNSSEELFALQDQTLGQKTLTEAVDIIHQKAMEKPGYLNHAVINLGYVWGRWRGLDIEEDMLYVLFFDLFTPSAISRRVMEDWKWKTELDSKGPLIVIHNQIHTPNQNPNSYPGCQRTMNTDFISVFLGDFLFKDKDYRVLMVGAGFEALTVESLRLTELSSVHKVHVYPQFDIMRTTANHQLHNSLYAFWFAIESDYFIATTCESQFLSHIFMIRKFLGKPTCSIADVSKTSYPDAYPEKYFKESAEHAAYRFPHPYRGSFFTVERCKFPLKL
ncbi:hypothetical protein C9374_002534 [Naegleria lovaniensis]|uniref:Uncharacterized protein n=1 Tax=Naegleria lovaniensis TaxID=51637 RepID=A0AA88GTP5_NAELO|nr:uncharacterized protein C9374_002534 [Naegleria lovaniensis]KAG2386088.1 hypothetical protein C9374_002534 [Naegleria lovaniensis]